MAACLPRRKGERINASIILALGKERKREGHQGTRKALLAMRKHMQGRWKGLLLTEDMVARR
jgi:ketosteroid isomerase-like protein